MASPKEDPQQESLVADLWSPCFEHVQDVFACAEDLSLWRSGEDMCATFEKVKATFAKNVGKLDHELAFIFDAKEPLGERTKNTLKIIRKWHDEEERPSIAAICAVAMDGFGVTPKAFPHLCTPVLVAGVLGEIDSNLTYHNNLHFSKVVLHTARLIAAHNKIFSGTSLQLSHHKMAALLIAAAIHDYAHDGTRNLVDHQYHFAKIEQRSFGLARPFLAEAGLNNDLLEDIRILLIVTDVSPFGNAISPANQLRSAYEYHYGTSDEEDLCLSPELAILEERGDLCLLGMLLHEADIMNSAGLSYDMTVLETSLLVKEIGKAQAYPEDVILFLETICHGGFVTDAAQDLGAQNFLEICKRIRDDIKNGNKPYPKPEETPFLKQTDEN